MQRLPPPLICAITLAIAIATCGPRPRTVPAGSEPDDRIADSIAGTIGGPIVRTPLGTGAPLHGGGTTVWLWSEPPLVPGQRVVAIGRLRTPRGALAPGTQDRAAQVASRGAEWELTAQTVRVLGEDDGIATAAWRWADRVQREWIARVPGDDGASAALRGIVTGDRGGVPDDLDQRWRQIGIYHVLSVSGLHLAVVAGLAFGLLCKLLAASRLGGRIRPARWAAPIAIVLAVAYTLITGAQLATLRSLVVVVVVLAGQWLERPVRLVDALGVAAIAILAWRPQDLYDPSFQLSFVAALTLALRPRVAPSDGPLHRRVVRAIGRGVATSAWVALATAPITALCFQQVAIGGVAGNLVLTPLLELVGLPLGLAGIVLHLAPLVSLAVLVVRIVDALAQLLAAITPAGTIAIGSPLVMVALVVLAIVLAARTRRTRLDAAVWAALCITWTFARTPAPPGTLRVTFLDVGQGDAALIELPDGHVWLVDAGGLPSSHELQAATAPGRTIARALAVYGHSAIDLAILSHPHPDHYLGLAALGVPVHELWLADPAADEHTGGLPSLAAITRALAGGGTRVVRPSLGAHREAGVTLDVWAPRYGDELAPDPVRSVNDNSLVVTVSYAGRTVLFAGDLEIEGEEALVDTGIGAVDVVKVAHHGSPTSSSAGFVAATRPALAVISCGVANPFGFPAPDVVARWRAAGARVERTDLVGSITVTVARDGALAVEPFRTVGP